MDTIFAQATAPGRSGLAVVRLSGPLAFDVAQDMCGPLPDSHKAVLRELRDPKGALIDEALVLPFRGPRSFTGEDVVELHLHGSPAIVSAAYRLLSSYDDVRMAEPGEFTRRALENERLDLAQVEGLSDLINAETDAQRVQAMRVFSGHLGHQIEGWRSKLIRAAALLEATIDFADEDVPVDVVPEVGALLAELKRDLENQMAGTRVAERVRSGFEVALVGPPNVGKSTLLNALAKRDAAITSEIAGTTRDVVEVRMDLEGLPVTFLDTAGLRETDDIVEKLGIQKTIERAETADLRVFLYEDRRTIPLNVACEDIMLYPKGDLQPDNVGKISGLTGLGVEDLLSRIAVHFRGACSEIGVATHERHRRVIENALVHLDKAVGFLDMGVDCFELVAEELRTTIFGLEQIIGRVDVENLLTEIFQSFCIGK
ncbi:MAG: tRNA uridine-5-carboxymethylaminomethyl(34) synthesis GTPase MnmE [Pseudomonadota bacterium]